MANETPKTSRPANGAKDTAEELQFVEAPAGTVKPVELTLGQKFMCALPTIGRTLLGLGLLGGAGYGGYYYGRKQGARQAVAAQATAK
jgi:hypothetical protein